MLGLLGFIGNTSQVRTPLGRSPRLGMDLQPSLQAPKLLNFFVLSSSEAEEHGSRSRHYSQKLSWASTL